MILYRLVFACVLVIGALGVASCAREAGDETRRVVLYSSVDDYVLREVVRDFERETGIEVLLVGDTEATKTTGLVTRLLAEKDAPKADVWWSSEPFGTIRLAKEGVLDAYASADAEAAFEDGWPAWLRGEGGTWYGFALRARVIAYSTKRVEDPPNRLRDLTDPRWKGRVGIARPQFGTTRGHMGALTSLWGLDNFESWLEDLKANGVRLYDGNATVVRKIAEGEIDIGLTDTDDVWAGQRNGWDVELTYEDTEKIAMYGKGSFGPLIIPNTAAIVRGAPNRDEAEELMNYLLMGPAERALRSSDSHNWPVFPGVGDHPDASRPWTRFPWDLEAIAERVPEAIAICERVLD
ncbi:MAG: iron transporter [Phycisphaeraceae bacterium]|nr:MAG: iron transporter [Phycisphaeraceae bacterium]